MTEPLPELPSFAASDSASTAHGLASDSIAHHRKHATAASEEPPLAAPMTVTGTDPDSDSDSEVPLSLDPLPAFEQEPDVAEPESPPESEAWIESTNQPIPQIEDATPLTAEPEHQRETEPEPIETVPLAPAPEVEASPVVAPVTVAAVAAAPVETTTTVVTVLADQQPSQRLLSLDAFRGFIMLLMISGGFGIVQLAKQQPGTVWETLAPYFQHAAWVGCTPWDLIQPAFMFMVGVALPFSLAKRQVDGQSHGKLLWHAALRSIVLVALGVLVASSGHERTHWTFTNVLAQIGHGYFFLYLFSRRSSLVVGLWMAFLLLCYWLCFAIYPMPKEDFPLGSLGASQEMLLPQPFTPWSKHINAAADLDRLLLNEFPREKLFVFNDGGYQTLNFVSSLVTMMLGLLCGRWLRSDRSHLHKAGNLILYGLLLGVAGWFAGEHLCPLVKRIWTPSWVLFSGGLVMVLLAMFYLAIEVFGWKGAFKPLAIVGMNSIFAYLAYQLASGWTKATLEVHFGNQIFAGSYGPMVERVTILAIIWLLCWWLYRRRAFLSI